MKVQHPISMKTLRIFLMITILDTSAGSSLRTSNVYNRSHTDQGLGSSNLLQSYADTKSCSECAARCSEVNACLSFDCSSAPKQDNTIHCDLHKVKMSQSMVSRQGFDHYQLVDGMETTVSTTTVTMTTTSAPAPCSEPVLSSNTPLTCSGTKLHIHAAIKVNGGGCLIFNGNGKYYKCNTITDILVQQGKPCAGPVTILGDSNLDPGNIWPGGPPDAAAAKMDSTQSNSRYYLFKGDTRYCYKHGSSSAPWLKPCSTKTQKIADRYSGGMPTTPLDAAWTPFDYSWSMTFYKGNQIYSVASHNTSGSVVSAATPVRSSGKWSNIPCDITAALTGMNSPQMIFFKGNEYYEYNADTKALKHTGKVCQ